MKAQVNIEFILSVFLFIVVLVFIGFSVINTFPLMHSESLNLVYRSKAYQASEMLMATSGVWRSNDVIDLVQIGLTDGEDYMLNMTKIEALDGCSREEYDKIGKLLGMDPLRFSINITRIDFSGGPDVTLSECSSGVLSTISPKFVVRRFAVSEERVVRLDISVY